MALLELDEHSANSVSVSRGGKCLELNSREYNLCVDVGKK